MNKIHKLLCCLVVLFGTQLYASDDDSDYAKEIVESVCMECHIRVELADRGYDFKLWELTVERMRSYSELTDSEVYDVANYLAQGRFEKDFFPERFKDDEPDQIVPQAEPEIPVVATAGVNLETLKKAYNVQQFWNPSSGYLLLARHLGYLSLVMLIIMAATSCIKQRIEQYFTVVHRSAAYIMIASVITHTTIYLFKFGAPSVLWLWFGILSAATLIISELSGEARQHFSFVKKYFVHIHHTAGWLCLVGVILHWIWAWL